jgi:hypothetical protein
MTPGRYVMHWAGYSQPVQVIQHGGRTMFVPASGYPADIETVPDARFSPALPNPSMPTEIMPGQIWLQSETQLRFLIVSILQEDEGVIVYTWSEPTPETKGGRGSAGFSGAFHVPEFLARHKLWRSK